MVRKSPPRTSNLWGENFVMLLPRHIFPLHGGKMLALRIERIDTVTSAGVDLVAV